MNVLSSPRIAVIGAGWAGCAAAVQAAQSGAQVSVFEAGQIPGGRARRVIADTDWPHPLDNGAHLLIGAYRECLRMMHTVGLAPEQVLQRIPLTIRYAPGEAGIRFIAGKGLPAPLHLAWGFTWLKGLNWVERGAILRCIQSLKAQRWKVDPRWTVSTWLQAHRQPARVVDLLWEPLCLAALNTSVQEADAALFAIVLRDTLGGCAADSDLLLPRTDLSALFPEAAIVWLRAAGHRVALSTTVTRLHRQQCWEIDGAPFDAIILATQPSAAAKLLTASRLDVSLPDFAYRPITTVYLRLQGAYRLPSPLFALNEKTHPGLPGQWVFDRAALRGDPLDAPGELAVVMSAYNALHEGQDPGFAGRVHARLQQAFPGAPLPPLACHRTLVDKRATLSATPGLTRPSARTRYPGLFLAGDYTETGYPSTLEGAVRSGVAAANLIFTSHPKSDYAPL